MCTASAHTAFQGAPDVLVVHWTTRLTQKLNDLVRYIDMECVIATSWRCRMPAIRGPECLNFALQLGSFIDEFVNRLDFLAKVTNHLRTLCGCDRVILFSIACH